MSDDYYEHHPTARLHEPLVLLGHPGSDVASIARDLSARTGLPFNEVARAVEARAGRSLLRIHRENGVGALAELEEQQLHAALDRRPCGVVAVSSSAVAHSGAERWLSGVSRVIAVHRPTPELLRRHRRSWESTPGSSEFTTGPPEDEAELEALLAPWKDALAAAHVQLDAGDRHAARVAEDILRHETGGSLELLTRR
jgi:shikimate kinase